MIELNIVHVLEAAALALQQGRLQAQKPYTDSAYSGPCAIGVALDGRSYSSITSLMREEIVHFPNEEQARAASVLQSAHDTWNANRSLEDEAKFRTTLSVLCNLYGA